MLQGNLVSILLFITQLCDSHHLSLDFPGGRHHCSLRWPSGEHLCFFFPPVLGAGLGLEGKNVSEINRLILFLNKDFKGCFCTVRLTLSGMDRKDIGHGSSACLGPHTLALSCGLLASQSLVASASCACLRSPKQDISMQ